MTMIATRTFQYDDGDYGTYTIGEGELVDDTHAAVRRHPELFQTEDEHRRHERIRSLAARGQGESGDGQRGAGRDDRRQPDDDDAFSRGGRAARDAGLRAVDGMGYLSARAGDRLADLIERDRSGQDARYIAAVADPAYGRAFMRYITNPQSASMELDPKEAAAFREARVADEMRALSVGSGTLPIPASIDPTIRLTNNGQINPIRQLATVTAITTTQWQGVTSAGVTPSFDAELAEVSDDTPTVAAPTLIPEKAQAYVEFSIESGMDWGSLQEELVRAISDAKDVLEASKFTTGAGHGSTEPQGLISGATGTVAMGTAAFAVANVYSLQQALPPRFSANAVWLSSLVHGNTSWKMVASGDATNAPIWDADRTRLLGKPWYEVSDMSTTLTAGQRIFAYGSVADAYRVIDRAGMSVELVPLVMGATRRPIGARALYCWWRTTGGIVVQQAIKVGVTT
jgi:HK97 family phage major capsid protein